MEQGNRLDSTRMSAAQDVRDDTGPDHGLDAAVAALLTSPSEKVAAPEPDPILAAIAETRRLMSARNAANDLPQPAGSIYPLPEQDAACDAFFAHVNDVLLKTIPTTGAGCAALARYAVEFRGNEGFNLDEDESNEQHVRILDLIARSPLAAPASPSASDLAIACVEQIKRLEQWDENPDAVSEKQGDEEMDRWNAVFRRAIEESSTCLRDLAGKAYLMLADLDRFMPEDAEQYQYDNYRLMRIIMREAIAMGGLTYAAAARDRAVAEHLHGDATLAGPGAAEPDVDQHDLAFHGASTDLRLANREYDRLINQADHTWVKQNGGDLSAESMAAAEVARDAALARQEQAWRDLFNIRPRTNHQMWLLLRDVAMHFEAHQGMADEPDVFGALIGAADGLRANAPELVAPYDLTRLSISQLEDLADICGRQSRAMLDARKGTDESPLGSVLENEQYRIGRLAGMACAEIERRVPANDDERNLRLETLARADLAGNGYIEPKLLSELVAAWGAR